MINSFHFECTECKKQVLAMHTSNGGSIPSQNDEEARFYVTCPICYCIILIEIKITKTVMMTSNMKKESANGLA
jgi:hypothetical protein